MERTVAEHREILELLLKGDTQRATKAIREHLSDRYLHSDKPTATR